MNFSAIVNHLQKNIKEIVADEDKKIISVSPNNWLELATIMKNDPALKFDYLMCISSYDKCDNKTYGAAYNFYSIALKHYIEIRIEVEEYKTVALTLK